MTTSFRAPWSGQVKALSVLGTVVLLGTAGTLLALERSLPRLSTLLTATALLLLAVFSACALGAVRGYRLEPDRLRVVRALGSTAFPLARFRGVRRDPEALRLTVLGFGNNGLFAISGWRRVSPYGWCRVLATRRRNGVVLEAAAGCALIVSPERPDEFAREVELRLAARAGRVGR